MDISRMDHLYKTYSASSRLSTDKNGLVLPLYRTSIRSAAGIFTDAVMDKQEYRRALGASLAACAEINVILAMIGKANALPAEAVTDLSNEWSKAARRISGSKNKLKSDE